MENRESNSFQTGNKPLIDLRFGCRMDMGHFSARTRTLTPIKDPEERPLGHFFPTII
jgi:hypothetical protein